MATSLALAMRITADASKFRESLTPVERAFNDLQRQAQVASDYFDRFAESTAAAAEAQSRYNTDVAFLLSNLRTGKLSAEEFAKAFDSLRSEAKALSQVFEDGAKTAEKYRTESESLAAALTPLAEQAKAGAISVDTLRKAVEDVSGVRVEPDAVQAFADAAKGGTLDVQAFSAGLVSLRDAQDKANAALAAAEQFVARYGTEAEKAAASLTGLADEVRGLGEGGASLGSVAAAFEKIFGFDVPEEELRAFLASVADGKTDFADFADRLSQLRREQDALTESQKQAADFARLYGTEAEKLAIKLQTLADQAKAGGVGVESLARAIESAAGVQLNADDVQAFADAARDGTLDVTAFAEQLASLKASQDQAAAALAAAEQFVTRYGTEAQKAAASLSSLADEIRGVEGGSASLEAVGNAFEKIFGTDVPEEELRAFLASVADGDADFSALAERLAAVKAEQDALTESQKRAAEFTRQYGTDAEKLGQQLESLASAIETGVDDASLVRAVEAIAKVDLSATDTGRELLLAIGSAAASGSTDLSRFAEALAAEKARQEEANTARERAIRAAEAISTAEDKRRKAIEDLTVALTAGTVGAEQAAQSLARLAGTDDSQRVAALQGAVASLAAEFSAGAITQEQYSAGLSAVVERETEVQEALEASQSILTAARASLGESVEASDSFAKAEEQLTLLLDEGAISTDQYRESLQQLERLRESTPDSINSVSEATKRQNSLQQEAARVIEGLLTPQEKQQRAIARLRELYDAGTLTQREYALAVRKTEEASDQQTRSITEQSVAFLAFAKKIEIGIAVVQSLAGYLSRTTGEIDALGDFAEQTGIQIESLQEFGIAAELAGASAGELNQSIRRLSVNIGQAAENGEFDQSLQRVNLSVRELQSLAPDRQFLAIADAIGSLPTEAERASAAVSLLGKTGAALAPLFARGSAAVEEIAQRAQRLGIVVSEVQQNNIGDMNDAFDLVRATIDGITNQIIGNLAPIVTTITEQFLSFVEGFESASGNGGTGIANVITDILLDLAETIAGVIDFASETFSGVFMSFSDTVAVLQGVFNAANKIFSIFIESLKFTFATFEAIGAALAKVIGNAISYIPGTGTFGEDMAAAAAERELAAVEKALDAGRRIARNAKSLVFGTEEPEEAATGAAKKWFRGFRSELERSRTPEFKVETDLEKTREDFDELFGGVIDFNSEITKAMQEYEQAVASVANPLKITQEELAKINEAQEKANKLIREEQAERTRAAEKARAQGEADRKRVDALIEGLRKVSETEETESALERERIKTEADLKKAEEKGDERRAEQLRERLRDIGTLQQDVARKALAEQQGFLEGFDKAFAQVQNTLNQINEQAQQLGEVGARAANRLNNGVRALQEQAEKGQLTKAEFDAGVKREQELFQKRAQLGQQLEQEFAAQAGPRFQAEQEFLKRAAEQRAQSADNIKILEEEIADRKQQSQKALEQGDLRTAKRLTQQAKQLENVVQKQKQWVKEYDAAVKNGTLLQDRQVQSAGQALQSLTEQAAQKYAEQVRSSLDTANSALDAFARAQQRQAQKLREIFTLGPRTLQGADLRTAEGAALLQNLASQAQDPAQIERRRQTKLLQLISGGIQSAAANYFAQPVAFR